MLEGPPGAVEDVIAFCRTGPPAARVVRVDVEDQEPAGERGFTVR